MSKIEKKSLTYNLKIIKKVFDLESILHTKIDLASIVKYYKINKWAYSIFYSRENLIHLGISRDKEYKKDDLLEAVKFVEKYIKNVAGFKVLELGTGRGANSKLLAQHFQNVQFIGLDISFSQLKFAKKVENTVPNYKAYIQDFHDLSKLKEGEFDVVFEIESVCNSSEKRKVLHEVKRVLKKDGVFILIDGWLQNKRETYSKEKQEAFRLVEIGMSLKRSDTYSDFKEMAMEEGFSIDFEEDDSQYILPSTLRQEQIARLFFQFPFIAKMITHFFPNQLLLIYGEK